MKENLLPSNIKHPVKQDIDQVIEFMNECDIAEYGEADSDLDELSDQWNEVELDQDVWISTDSSGKINGYALLSEEGEKGRFFDLYTHRVNAPAGLEEVLIDLGIGRLHTLIQDGKSSDPCGLTTFMSGINTKNRAAIESKGFSVQTYHYRMQIDFQGPVTAPTWPAELTLSPFSPEKETDLYALISSTFEWQGLVMSSFDTWKERVFRNGRFDPELFLLVHQAGRLVGAAICYDEETRGWIKEIAVGKEMQGKGLGSLLLQQVYSIFSARGIPTVALGVASANEKAYHFYERNGMRRTREFVQYHQPICARF